MRQREKPMTALYWRGGAPATREEGRKSPGAITKTINFTDWTRRPLSVQKPKSLRHVGRQSSNRQNLAIWFRWSYAAVALPTLAANFLGGPPRRGHRVLK